jgi:hypothetical protein
MLTMGPFEKGPQCYLEALYQHIKQILSAILCLDKILCKMKIPWFKSSTTVKNPAQAGDAALAFYLGKDDSHELEINTQDMFPVYDQCFPEKQKLSIWGVENGFKEITLLQDGSFISSLVAMKFTTEEISKYTHFVLKEVPISFEEKSNEKITVTTNRFHHLDRDHIVTGYY